MHTEQEALTFIDETRFAIDQLFTTLDLRRKAMESIKESIKEELRQIESAETVVQGLFIDRDQWSPDANYHYGQFIKRMEMLAHQKREVESESGREQRLRTLLARQGATEESMAVIAGSILQLGKQVLSFRFGAAKPSLQNGRAIGTQSVVEVIWEGRNHALHWEDPNPRSGVRNMLQSLANDLGTNVDVNRNNSLAILAALGWSDGQSVVDELRTLVAAQ